MNRPVNPDRWGDEFATLMAQVVTAVAVRQPPAGMTTRVVAIDGLGGAGKSTFAKHLSTALGGTDIVHTDEFATWANPVDWWPQLIEKVLKPVSRNELVRYQPSQWDESHDPEPVEFLPSDYLIVEGVTAAREAFAPYLTYAIWIEAPEDVRLSRGIERDGQDAREQWRVWMADETAYQLRERPDERADVVIRGDRSLWT